MPEIRISWVQLPEDIVLIDIYKSTESIHGTVEIGDKIKALNIESDLEYFGDTPVTEWFDNPSASDIYRFRVKVTDAWGNVTISDPAVVDGTLVPDPPEVTAELA